MDDNEIKDIARDVHHTVVTTGRYKRDSEQWHMPDYWKSYWEGANRGERWEGDCDNFAMTSYVGACERGVPPERVNLIACCVEIFKDGGGHTGPWSLTTATGRQPGDPSSLRVTYGRYQKATLTTTGL